MLKRARICARMTKLKETLIVLLLLLSSTGCVVVGGYSTERGWFIWPGTFIFLGIALLVILLLRRRR